MKEPQRFTLLITREVVITEKQLCWTFASVSGGCVRVREKLKAIIPSSNIIFS